MPRSRFPAVLALLVAASAHADAPLRTDNAYVAAPGAAKLEALYTGTPADHSFAANATYVVIDRLELGAAYARGVSDAAGASNDIGLAAKLQLVKDDPQQPFALAATFSIARDTGAPSGRSAFQTGWLNVPASYAPTDDWRLHANAGALWQPGLRTLVTWGAATEWDVDRVTLLAEAYRIEPGASRYNAGARFAFSPGFSVYASVGRAFGHDPGDWLWTAGIKLETERLFE